VGVASAALTLVSPCGGMADAAGLNPVSERNCRFDSCQGDHQRSGVTVAWSVVSRLV
jgi:hypothetical protein